MATELLESDLKQKSGAAASEESLVGEGHTESDELSLFDVLVILVERRRTIIWITGVCAVMAVIASLLQPKKFTATVTLLPPQQSSSVSANLGSQLSSLGGAAALASSSLGLKNPNEMFVAMLKSRTVEDAMVGRFGLVREYHAHYLSDARKAFENTVTIDGSGKDGLIHISVEARDPQRAADLANGYVDQFRVLSQNLAITEAAQRRLFFERQLEQTKDNFAKAEEALKETEQRTGLIQLDSQARALIESAASLRAQIAAKEVQIQGIETYATGENPQLVQAQRELISLRAQLDKLGGSEDSSSGGLIVPRGKVPALGLEYIRKFREVKYQETIFDILARQFEIAKLDEAKQGALIQVVDAAIPPDKRSSPKRAVLVVCATVMGALFAVFFVLLEAGFERMKANAQSQERFAILKRALNRNKSTVHLQG